MTPRYRKMVLEEKAFTPISQMSQAFFNAESGEHLMFAYYQSMLVVGYIVDNYGFDALRNILVDLGNGILINPAIRERAVRPIQRMLDFAREHGISGKLPGNA